MSNAIVIAAMSNSEISVLSMEMSERAREVYSRIPALIEEYNAIIMREGRTSLHCWHKGFNECAKIAERIKTLESAAIAYTRAADAYNDIIKMREGKRVRDHYYPPKYSTHFAF